MIHSLLPPQPDCTQDAHTYIVNSMYLCHHYVYYSTTKIDWLAFSSTYVGTSRRMLEYARKYTMVKPNSMNVIMQERYVGTTVVRSSSGCSAAGSEQLDGWGEGDRLLVSTYAQLVYRSFIVVYYYTYMGWLTRYVCKSQGNELSSQLYPVSPD